MSTGLIEAGFGTLAQLKARVLPKVMETYDDDGEWDDDLIQIGRGVAGEFNRYCNRTFQRGTVTEEVESGASSVVLSRYPVEEITAVELIQGTDVSDRTDQVRTIKQKSGIVYWETGCLGSYRDRLTVSYTGGFWLGGEGAVSPGTQIESVKEVVPEGVATVRVAIPSGFTGADVASVTIEALTDAGDLEVRSYRVDGNEVVVRLSGQADSEGDFQVSMLLLRTPASQAQGGDAPAEAVPLPNEIFNAWVLQCQAVMEHANTLWGAGVQRSEEKVGELTALEMIPAVKTILNTYRRYR